MSGGAFYHPKNKKKNNKSFSSMENVRNICPNLNPY